MTEPLVVVKPSDNGQAVIMCLTNEEDDMAVTAALTRTSAEQLAEALLNTCSSLKD